VAKNQATLLMVEIGDHLSLEFGSRGSKVFGMEGDPKCLSGGVFLVDLTSGGAGIA